MSGSDCALCKLTINIRQRIWQIIAGEHILEPHDVEGFESASQTDGIGKHPTRTAIQCQSYFITEDGFHCIHARDYVIQAALSKRTTMRMRHIPKLSIVWRFVFGVDLTIEEIWNLRGHQTMKTDTLLDNA